MPRVQAQQRKLRVVLAALQPGGDVAVPEPVDGCAIVVETERAVQRRVQVVAFGGEGRDGTDSARQRLDELVVGRSEELDRAGILLELRHHRSCVTVLDAIKSEHQGAVGI